MISERTVAGRQAAKRRGRHVGRPPKLTAHKVAHARELIAAGKETQAGAAAFSRSMKAFTCASRKVWPKSARNWRAAGAPARASPGSGRGHSPEERRSAADCADGRRRASRRTGAPRRHSRRRRSTGGRGHRPDTGPPGRRPPETPACALASPPAGPDRAVPPAEQIGALRGRERERSRKASQGLGRGLYRPPLFDPGAPRRTDAGPRSCANVTKPRRHHLPIAPALSATHRDVTRHRPIQSGRAPQLQIQGKPPKSGKPRLARFGFVLERQVPCATLSHLVGDGVGFVDWGGRGGEGRGGRGREEGGERGRGGRE